MVNHFELLAAGWGDLLKALPILIPILIWVAAQMMGGDKNKPIGQKKPPLRPQVRPKPAQAAPQNQVFRDEIEAFLKKAAEKRGQPPAQPPRREAARPQPVGKQPPRQIRPKSAWTKPAQPQLARPLSERPVMAEVVSPPKEKDPWAGDVSQHVKQHINVAEITEHTAHLGERVEEADEQFESHLHAAFDHKIGQLDDSVTSEAVGVTPGLTRDAPHPQAQAIVNMLRNSTGVRQAILIGEILKRPELD